MLLKEPLDDTVIDFARRTLNISLSHFRVPFYLTSIEADKVLYGNRTSTPGSDGDGICMYEYQASESVNADMEMRAIERLIVIILPSTRPSTFDFP